MIDDGAFSLQSSRIAIIGLGLMGGSLALALKGKCSELTAVIPKASTRDLALKLNIVSKASDDPEDILPFADVVVLSTPVPAILEWLDRLQDYMDQRSIVIDMGSSKQVIVQKMSQLPERFAAIGGHPICGKENLSLENAEASLYINAPFVLSPPERLSVRASTAALQIIEAVGARPLWLDASLHDRLLAYTSHLPFLLASALAMTAPMDAASLVGPGFNSTSRLASTPSSMMLGIIQTNRDNILQAISKFKKNLEGFEDAIRENDTEKLGEQLDEARVKRQKFL
jgi:prephenate dehydrogenase